MYAGEDVGLNMNKRILLVNSPNYDSDDKRRLRPLGISYLAASLRKHGFECDILDPNCRSEILSVENILDEICEKEYAVVGISAVTPNFHHAVELAEKIKYSTHSMIILGGVHATFSHDKVIDKYNCFDVVMRGEGEYAIVELIKDFFVNGKFTYPVSGCTYLDLNGKKHYAQDINSLNTIENLPLPAQDNCMEYSETLVNGKLLKNISIITSRGCPYDCIFCSVTSLRRRWITRTPEDIANEVLSFYKQNKNIFIVFSDDNFYIDKVRACSIIDEMHRVCGDIIPFCFATRTDLIVRHGIDTLLYLQKNGCYSIELGVENGDDNVLKRMGKRNNAKNNIDAIKLIQSAGINVGIDFILFDPWTTLNEIKQNVSFLKEAGLWGYFPALIYVRMLPYPGTKLSSIMNVEYNRFEKLEGYFLNDKIKCLFDMVMEFKNRYQKTIDIILDNLKTSNAIKDILNLKLLPYLFLEKAVSECEKSYPSFEKVVAEIDADKIITRIKNKYDTIDFS